MENILNNLRINKTRCRIWYGDKETGKSWDEEYDTIGTIGRSTGTKPIFILIKNSRSIGGGAILVDSIVKIVDISNGRELYKHPYFKSGLFIASGLKVFRDSEIFANCKNEKQAERLAAFMNGQRNSK